MSQKMFYIQNYDYCPKNNLYRADTTGRFLEGQYMGSSEFEFGSVQESWQYLRENDIKLFEHEAQSKGGLAKKVTFFVITTDEGFERFKENIEIHLDGTTIGYKSKDYTNIWDKFNAMNPVGRMPAAWLDVSCFVIQSCSQPNAIFFTDHFDLALRTFMELKRDDKRGEIRVFDEVYAPACGNGIQKVCGLNEDDTISTKAKYGKATKHHPNDLWLKEDIVRLNINEKIKVSALNQKELFQI